MLLIAVILVVAMPCFSILVAPACVLWIMWAYLDQRRRVYSITTRRVTSQWGIIARSSAEVLISDIRVISMQRNLSDGILGIGTVQVGSAGTAGFEVQFAHISNPETIRDLIQRTKDQLDDPRSSPSRP